MEIRELRWNIVWKRWPPAWTFRQGQGALLVREHVDAQYRTFVELYSYVVLPDERSWR